MNFTVWGREPVATHCNLWLFGLQAVQPKLEAMEAAWYRLHSISGAATPDQVIAYWEGIHTLEYTYMLHLRVFTMSVVAQISCAISHCHNMPHAMSFIGWLEQVKCFFIQFTNRLFLSAHAISLDGCLKQVNAFLQVTT